MKTAGHTWFAALLLAAALTPSTAAAQPSAGGSADRDAARATADRAHALFEAGRYAGALALFRDAEARYHAPTHVLYVARTLARLGHLVEAVAAYERVTAETLPPAAPAPYKQAQLDARRERVILERRIPTIQLVVWGPTAEPVAVRIDGVPIPASALARPVRVDPGKHAIVADVRGFERLEKNVSVAEGARTELVTLALERSSVSTPPRPGEDVDAGWQLVAGIGVMSVGAALGGAGIVSAFQVGSVNRDPTFDAYRASHRASRDVCKDADAGTSRTDATVSDLCSKGKFYQTLEYALFGASGIALGVGAVLVLTSKKHPDAGSPRGFVVTPRAGRGVGKLDVSYTF